MAILQYDVPRRPVHGHGADGLELGGRVGWHLLFTHSLVSIYSLFSASSSFNNISMWVKIVAQWVTILLFSWTLVAPKLFPDRDFS